VPVLRDEQRQPRTAGGQRDDDRTGDATAGFSRRRLKPQPAEACHEREREEVVRHPPRPGRGGDDGRTAARRGQRGAMERNREDNGEQCEQLVRP